MYIFFSKDSEFLIHIYSTMETLLFDHFNFFRLNFPFLMNLYRTLEYSITATKYLKNAIYFLEQCLIEQVIPASLTCSIYTNFSNEPFPTIYKYLLENRIGVLKRELDCKYSTSSYLYNLLKSKLHSNIFYKLVDFCHMIARNKSERRRSCLSVKLEQLCSASPWNKFSCTENVINLSSYNLTQDEKIFLGLGLGFSMPPTKKDKFSFLSKICRRNDYLSIFGPQAGFQSSNKLPQRFFKAFLSLKSNKNIIIKPADKGGSVVVLDVHQYKSKCNLLLQDADTYCQPPSQTCTYFQCRCEGKRSFKLNKCC